MFTDVCPTAGEIDRPSDVQAIACAAGHWRVA